MSELIISSGVGLINECTCCCAKHSLSKIKHLNTICIGCLCLLGIGVTGLSSYFGYKLWKLSKKFDEYENTLECLNIQLNLIDDYNDRKLLNEERDDDEQAEEKRPSKENIKIQKSILNSPSKPILNNKLKEKSVSFESDLDEISYETPGTSPEQNHKHLFYLESSNAKKNLNQDDNKLYDRYLNGETYESLKDMSERKRHTCEADPYDINETIDCIRVLYALGDKEKDQHLKKSLQFEAFELAKRCSELDPNNYLAHKWLSMTIGKVVDYLSLKEKVKYGFDFKKHLDLAININGSDYVLYYLRGRWFFKMCNLSWIERNGIKVLFGSIPSLNIDDAIKDFEKVEELHTGKSKGNLLHLAKCLISKNKIHEAREALNKAINLPVKTAEHLLENQEIEAMLKKYK